MGICTSSQLYNPTGKLIMEDGELMEFVKPLEVSEILRGSDGFFICDSDSMEIDQYLSPLPPQYQMKPGHLYFELPVDRLRFRLPASDMAAMAMQACEAMREAKHGKKCSCKIIAFHSRNKVVLEEELEELNYGGRSETISSPDVNLRCFTAMGRKAGHSRLPTIPESLAC